MAIRSTESALVKKPHQREKFTRKQMDELAKCLDPKTGYEYFVRNYFYIQHPTRGKMKFEPYEFQTRLLRAYHSHVHVIAMSPRQVGKTTCAAGYLLWYAMFKSDQTILVAAHKHAGSQEIMQRVRYAYETCPDFIRSGVISYNKGSIDFENNSRIISTTTTGNTGRGMSISLLYLDEFSHVSPTIAAEFWSSISPTLSTGGKAIITSTPSSDEDQFAQIWHDAQKKFDEYGNEKELGINGFHAFQSYWWEHPDRDEAWKQAQIGKIGQEKFDREFECKFLIHDETLINSTTLAGLHGSDPILSMGHARWFKQPSDDMLYVVTLDPSLGTGGDNAAIQVVEMPTMIQVAEWSNNTTNVETQVRIVRDICRYIKDHCPLSKGNNIYWSVENNTVGEAVLLAIRNMGEESVPGLMVSEPIKNGHVRKYRKGFSTTHRSKVAACSRLKYMVENGTLKINSRALISELKTYTAQGITFKAKSGSTDDLVSAILLTMRVNHVLADWDYRVFEIMCQVNDDVEQWEPPMPIYMTRTFQG